MVCVLCSFTIMDQWKKCHSIHISETVKVKFGYDTMKRVQCVNPAASQ